MLTLSKIGGGGHGPEPVRCIEDAAVEGHQRHQQQVRKGDAGERDRKREPSRIGLEAGRQKPNDGRGEGHRQRQHHKLAGKEQREDAVGEAAGRPGTLLLANPRVGGHEGGVKRAFGKNAAEMVRQSKRDQERIGDRPGAENSRHENVAQEAGEPRDQRPSADRQDPFDHAFTTTRLRAPALRLCRNAPYRVVSARRHPPSRQGRGAPPPQCGPESARRGRRASASSRLPRQVVR